MSNPDVALRVMHLTTVDMSLELLLGPQLDAVMGCGGEVIAVSAPGPYQAELARRGITVESLAFSTRRADLRADLRTMVEFWSVLRRHRPTVLHTHNPKPGLYGRVLGRLAGVPVVVNTVHGLYATTDDRWSKRAAVYALEWLASWCSDAELVQNPEDLAVMVRWPGRRRRQRLHLLGNGVDVERFASADPAAGRTWRQHWGVADDEVLIGAVGRLVAEKGYVELFAAVEHLPGVRLVVIGGQDPDKADALAPEVVARAREAGVIMAGFQTDMAGVYAAMDIFVLASHREGFPRAAMEAAAAGLPLVVTDIRGCRQVVGDGDNGVLVPVRSASALAEALGALAADPARRRAMGAASRRRAAADFDQRFVVDRVLAAYAEAAEARGLHLVPDPRD